MSRYCLRQMKNITQSAGVAVNPPVLNPKRTHAVLLLIESSREYGRGVLHGIASYLKLHPFWRCLHLEGDKTTQLDRWLKRWPPTGVIARIDDQKVAASLKRLNVPIVDLMGSLDLPGVVRIWTEADQVAQSVASHFLSKGLRHFAFCGYPGLKFSDMRSTAFAQLMQAKNFAVDVYSDPGSDARAGYMTREVEGAIREDELCDWLAALPKPVGVMACNDIRGQQVIDACQQCGIKVPEQVAVVGVDNDEVVCDFTQPSLSSVELNLKGIGFRAATALNRMMAGQTESPVIFVEPLGVVARLSSDLLAVDDPIVAQAMALIRDHVYEGINVEQLLDRLPVSRATLERRFAKYFNRSPKEEIIRVRFSCAERLLRETDYNLTQIAEMSGCKTAAHLSVVFKSRAGISPGDYRKRAREGLSVENIPLG